MGTSIERGQWRVAPSDDGGAMVRIGNWEERADGTLCVLVCYPDGAANSYVEATEVERWPVCDAPDEQRRRLETFLRAQTPGTFALPDVGPDDRLNASRILQTAVDMTSLGVDASKFLQSGGGQALAAYTQEWIAAAHHYARQLDELNRAREVARRETSTEFADRCAFVVTTAGTPAKASELVRHMVLEREAFPAQTQAEIDEKARAQATEIVNAQGLVTLEDARLFARGWIETALQYARNEAHWTARAKKAEEHRDGWTLRALQALLPQWNVNAFDHALFHVMKAAGKLAGMVDDRDHSAVRRSSPSLGELNELLVEEGQVTMRKTADGDVELRAGGSFAARSAVAPLLADLVVCAVKLAKECPSGEVDLEAAVLRRIREKNPPGSFPSGVMRVEDPFAPRFWKNADPELSPGAGRPKGAPLFGAYFPGTDLCVTDMGGRVTGEPKHVEWLDGAGDVSLELAALRRFRNVAEKFSSNVLDPEYHAALDDCSGRY